MGAPPWSTLLPCSTAQRELLKRMTGGRGQAATDRKRPRHFADVDVPAGVDGDTVWRGEAARRAGVGAAPSGQQPAVLVIDADAAVSRLVDRPVALRRLSLVPPQLGDVGAPVAIEHDVRGSLRVGPLLEILAVGAEDLDAIVLAIAHEYAAVPVDGNAVREIEFARSMPGHAPRMPQLAARGKAVHATVAVAVGDVEITLGPDREIRRPVERAA